MAGTRTTVEFPQSTVLVVKKISSFNRCLLDGGIRVGIPGESPLSFRVRAKGVRGHCEAKGLIMNISVKDSTYIYHDKGYMCCEWWELETTRDRGGQGWWAGWRKIGN